MLLTVAIGLWFGYVNANVCPNAGQTPLTNLGVNNYVIDWLYFSVEDAIAFPYAIGQCTSHSLGTSDFYYIHTCVKGQAQTQRYTDSGCNSATGDAYTGTSNNPDGVGYYECGGSDTYAQIGMGVTDGSSCPSLTTIYAGLSGCTDSIEKNVADFAIYCDSSQQTATIQWFISALANAKSGSQKWGLAPDSVDDVHTSPFPIISAESSTPIPIISATTSTSPSIPIISATSSTSPPVGSCTSAYYCFDSTITTSCQAVDEFGVVWAQYQGCSGSTTTTNTKKGAVQMHISILALIVAAVAVFLH